MSDNTTNLSEISPDTSSETTTVKKEHPPAVGETSLTAPSDRNPETRWAPDIHAEPLTIEQTKEAVKELNNSDFVERFPRVERRYADPTMQLQRIGLLSFVPAKGASPNEKGVFGFAKLRGNFATEVEARARAEFLIRNVDSYHQIYHTYVGRPFPITVSSDYSREVDRIDLRKEMQEDYGDDVKRKRAKEEKEIEEIKEKEKRLLEDVKKNPDEDTKERYTTLRTKSAQLKWTYVNTMKKLKEMLTTIAKTRREIEFIEKTDPEAKKDHINRYNQAREEAGLPTDWQQTDDSYIKYIAEDLKVPEADAEYDRLFGEDSDDEKEDENEKPEEETGDADEIVIKKCE